MTTFNAKEREPGFKNEDLGLFSRQQSAHKSSLKVSFIHLLPNTIKSRIIELQLLSAQLYKCFYNTKVQKH